VADVRHHQTALVLRGSAECSYGGKAVHILSAALMLSAVHILSAALMLSAAHILSAALMLSAVHILSAALMLSAAHILSAALVSAVLIHSVSAAHTRILSARS
jgi:hypothetical protein